MIVVATTATGLAEVEARCDAHELDRRGIATPAGGRCVVLAAGAHEAHEERVAALLRAEGLVAVARPDGGPRLDAWRHETRPVTIGGRLAICFAWSEHDRRDLPGLVELGTGGFGSGQHPTTRMVLDELADRIVGGERLLDVGCGSGVLGLAALRLGAREVVAVDLKPVAVEATQRNAVLNGMADRVFATTASVDALRDRFDVIVANVGRAATVELAPDLTRLLAPEGWLAVSGFSPAQCVQIAGYLPELAEQHRRTDGEWAVVVLRRRRS